MNRFKLSAPRAVNFVLLSLVAAACNGTGSDTGGSTGANSCTPATTSVAKPSVATSATQEQDFLSDHAAGSLKKLSAHIPAKVKEMADQGALASDQELPVTVALELNNEADLNQTLSDIYQPGNPRFGKYLTSADFKAKYAPTDAQIGETKALLASQGLTDLTVSENNMFIKAKGTPQVLNSAFHTELHQYKSSGNDEKAYFAPAYELQVPAGSAIKAVVGLQNITVMKKHAVQAKDAPHTGSGPSGGYIPSEITTAYNIPTSLNGSGQTLALFELDGYTASDVTAYETKFGLANVPLQNVLVDSATGSAGGGADEVTLDIELMIAVAPGASKILVYEGPNDDQGTLDTYAKIANDNLAQSVSTSWGTAEISMSSATLQAENTIFKQMAAQGQTIYSAAGDDGAYDTGSTSQLSVDDPSSQPYVTGVGGTKLTLSSNGGYGSETTWNEDGTPAGGGGGGGISTVWTIPSWQANAATGKTLGSTTMRNVPDVSLNADPSTGYAIYFGGAWTVYGGTSCAAPLWAGFTALVNQQRIANGKGTLGFPNGLLYGLGARYATDFHDIADGSTNMYYPAVTGYDDATGLGTINGASLLQDLSSDPNPTNSCS